MKYKNVEMLKLLLTISSTPMRENEHRCNLECTNFQQVFHVKNVDMKSHYTCTYISQIRGQLVVFNAYL